jgi:hypothetical protein
MSKEHEDHEGKLQNEMHGGGIKPASYGGKNRTASYTHTDNSSHTSIDKSTNNSHSD